MTTTANLQLYEQSAIDFLQSCTITFSPMADLINTNLLASGIFVDQTDKITWKYYINLSGNYHSSDTMMTILSLDTKTIVNFTKEMLSSHPRTALAYVVGSPYYNTLCQTYPSQTDLIKSIVYPVDINDAINAPDFTLLRWGDGFLEDTEQDVIIQDIKTFLNYATTRWYFGWMSYEAYYVWAFWACLWQALPNAIFSARLKYLKTANVHSFHIWSYLQSNGIGDYSDILTSRQALFLYRNLSYLIQNRGKQSNLILLVNNLLNSLNVGLTGKTIYMNTLTKAETCAWTPEFVSNIIPTQLSQNLQQIAAETMSTFNADLVNANLEVDSSISHINQQETQIGLTPYNILKTKFVEIEKLGVDEKYGGLLNNFILDTLVYGISSGLYIPTVTIIDPTTTLEFTLSGKEALCLYYYAVHRSCREQVTQLPTVYSPTCAFKPNVSLTSFPEEFEYNGHQYPTQSYLPLEDLIDGIGYPAAPVTDPNQFATIVANLFVVLIRCVRYSRMEGSKISLEMFLNYCKTILLQTTDYTITLDTATDYTTWIQKKNLSSLISQLDSNIDYTTAYNSLANQIMTMLLPEDNPIFTFYAYTSSSADDIYDRLKALFVQLCSYNIAFLDTERTNPLWFLYNRIVYTTKGPTTESSLKFEDQPTTKYHQKDVFPLHPLATDLEINVSNNTVYPIPIQEYSMITITQDDVRHVESPLTIEIRSPDMITDVRRISFQCLPKYRVITPSA